MQNPSLNYVITFSTFMLKPVMDENTLTTHVLERNQEFSVSKKPLQIIKRSSSFYGSSLKVLTNTSKLRLGNVHKVPILLAHAFNTPYILIPTLSPNSEHNTWLSYHAIDAIEPDSYGSIVHFENDTAVHIDISPATLYRQITLARFLEKDFINKQIQLNRSAFLFRPE